MIQSTDVRRVTAFLGGVSYRFTMLHMLQLVVIKALL